MGSDFSRKFAAARPVEKVEQAGVGRRFNTSQPASHKPTPNFALQRSDGIVQKSLKLTDTQSLS